MAKKDEKVEQIKDDHLEGVNGGGLEGLMNQGKDLKMSDVVTTSAYCNHCRRDTIFTIISGSRGKCNTCGNMQML